MGAFAISRWLVVAVQAVPPLQRALDTWSLRRAMERRARRLRLAAQRRH
ncbi:MAG TPA: hypothetical protein VIE63_01375 [Ramlibacter sp.]|jgi:hypothetical protein